jgi:hypothetical protein
MGDSIRAHGGNCDPVSKICRYIKDFLNFADAEVVAVLDPANYEDLVQEPPWLGGGSEKVVGDRWD